MDRCFSGTSSSHTDAYPEKEDRTTKMKAALFLTGLSGISIFGGFSYAVAAAKKRDPLMFDHGIRGIKNAPMSGSTLAMRALGWGSLYAVSGVTLICYLVWKFSGAQNMKEFRFKIGSLIPKISKNSLTDGRTDFENLSDLFRYIMEGDEKQKKVADNQNDKKQE